MTLNDIQLSGESIHKGTQNQAILDSGTSLITIPTLEFTEFMKIYSKRYFSYGFRCQLEPKLCFFMGKKCSEVRGKVDDIRIQLGGASYDFSVPFEDYTIDFNEKDVDYCIIGI